MNSTSALQNFGIPRRHTRGNGGTGISRRAHHGVMVMGNARRDEGANSWTQTTVGPKKISKIEVREGFGAVVADFSAAQLAKASGCTKDGAKHWLANPPGRCPDTASTINMARALPTVRAWLLEEIGAGAREIGSVDAVVRALHGIAAQTGAEAIQARQILALIAQTQKPNENRADNVVRDMFMGRA